MFVEVSQCTGYTWVIEYDAGKIFQKGKIQVLRVYKLELLSKTD